MHTNPNCKIKCTHVPSGLPCGLPLEMIHMLSVLASHTHTILKAMSAASALLRDVDNLASYNEEMKKEQQAGVV